MAVVYAVLCHRSPEAVAALAGWLRHPGHQLVLHADRGAPVALHDLIANIAAADADTHALDSEPCAWGGWSLVRATLRSVERALGLPLPWRHFVLLSEHHVPLQPPAAIAAALPDGVGWIETTPLTGMDRAARADLLHRFAFHYRELPGVGMFACEPRAPDAALLDSLRRGSQWVVLSRAACERLAGAGVDGALWAPFRDSLIPDETAIHTVLRGTDFGRGLEFRNFPATFMAWPHLGGGPDAGFTDALARRARARGHLFIRKRPDILPPSIRALLPAGPAIPRATPEAPAADAAELANRLAPLLRVHFPTATMRASAGGPTCLLQFHDATPDTLPICLLSRDMRHFKALLAWRRPFDGTLGPIRLGGYATSVLGARLPGLTLAREVYVPELPDHGFLGDDLTALCQAVSVLLAAARSLAPLAGDQASPLR